MLNLTTLLRVILLGGLIAAGGGRLRAGEAADAIAAGNTAIEHNDLAGGITSYSTAIRLSPDDWEGYLFRGRAYNLKGDWKAAISDCDTALRLHPVAPGAYVVRALAYANLKQLDRAASDATAAIRLEPRYADAFCLRAEILDQQGRADDALADFTRCIELDPQNFYPRFCRSGLYEKRGESALALADMTEAVRANPGSDEVANGLAWELATAPEKELRNGARALQYAWKACDLTQWKNAAYLDTLAAAYAEIDDFEEAVKWQRKAIALNPAGEDATELHDHLKLYQANQPYRVPGKPVKPAPKPAF